MKRGPHGQTRERIYQYIYECRMAGQPPTIREIQQAVGLRAVQTVQGHLQKLVDEGRLIREPGKARSYQLPSEVQPAAAPPLAVPILGHVAAGELSLAVEDCEGFVAVHAPSSERHQLFALRVRGESMRDAGILPDDLVIVRRQTTAAHGEIVVALVEDEATVKRLYRRDGELRLCPETPDFAPILPPPDRLQILGKVIEVRRRLE
jgi:repressor LexA